MAFCAFEDTVGETELIVFPRQLEEFGALLKEGAVLCVTGEITVKEAFDDEGEDELKIIIKNVSEINPNIPALYLKVTKENAAGLDRALREIKKSPGSGAIKIYYEESGKLFSPKEYGYKPSEELVPALKEIMGERNVALKQKKAVF